MPPNIGSIEPSKVQKPRSFNIPSANLLIFSLLKLQMTGMLLIRQGGSHNTHHKWALIHPDPSRIGSQCQIHIF